MRFITLLNLSLTYIKDDPPERCSIRAYASSTAAMAST